MTALLVDSPVVNLADPDVTLAKVAQALRKGEVVPFLGPGVVAQGAPAIPTTPEGLADFFGGKVALPRRAKGNAWTAAQYVESTKLRPTVTAYLDEAFATPAAPTPLETYLASLPLPLIVDTWYDGAMRTALSGRSDWAEVQGITRAAVGEDRWFRHYAPDGSPMSAADAAAAATILYKPHGAVTPDHNYLITDADYVEVLTEIDIQTPIPDVVKDRRTGRSFLFIGCRFHDQMLRTYARQTMKRSADEHYVIVDPETLSKNELRFFAAQNMTPIAVSIERATELLTKG